MTRQRPSGPRAHRLPLLIALCGLLGGGLAHAEDVIITTAGRRYVGTIVERTVSKIRIKTTLHNIPTVVELRMGEVARIEKTEEDAPEEERPSEPERVEPERPETDTPTPSELPRKAAKVERRAKKDLDVAPSADPAPSEVEEDGFREFTRSASAARTRGLHVTPAPTKRPGVPMYLEVPLRGTFGEDIYPKGVGEALLWAQENGVTDVLFRIESPGGAVWSAERIVELMNEYRGSLKFHALIERSISASIWPSFACDTIAMAPRSGFGGAVAFRIDADTGSAEVDLKMNSIRMAELVSQAEENGHSGHVVRAMMISDQALYAVLPEGEREWELRGSAPPPARRFDDVVPLDTPESILTLTAIQAETYGIAPRLESDDADAYLGVLGYDEWDSAGPAGYELTEHWSQACKEMMSKIEAQSAIVLSSLARYEAAEYVRPAIRALEEFKRDVARFDHLTRQAQELDLGVLIAEMDPTWRKFTSTQVERVLNDLRRQIRP